MQAETGEATDDAASDAPTLARRLRELRQVVRRLESEQRLATTRLELHATLARKLRRELVDERLAHIDTKKEVDELRRALRGDDGDAGPLAKSPLQERDNPWTSPAKTPGAAGGGSPGSKLMGFSFYPTEAEDEPLSPSSSTNTLRGTLMGQFLPSSLLDSPQMTPTRARSFHSDQSESSAGLAEHKPPATTDQPLGANEDASVDTIGGMDALSLAAAADNQTEHARDAARLETKRYSGTPSTSAASLSSPVSPTKLAMLAELLDGVPVDDLDAALRKFDGQEGPAMDHLLRTHPSFNPALAAGSTTSSGGGDGSVGLSAPLPSPPVGGGQGHKSGASSSSHRGGGATGPGSSNWKTEICMYYMQGKCNKTRRTCSFAHGESDLVRPFAASKPYGPGYKTRLCPAYENGACPRSRRDCPLAHGVNDLREPGGGGAGGAGTSGGVPGGMNNPALLPPPTPRLQSYKTELCYYYLKGNCNYTKEECRFAHGPSDLRTVESNTIAQMNAAAAAAAAFTAGPSMAAAAQGGGGMPPNFEKQLQLQQQYQQQHQQQHGGHHGFAPAQPQQQPSPHSFIPAHQLQSRGGGGGGGPGGPGAGPQPSFGFQPPPASVGPPPMQQAPPPPPPQPSPQGLYMGPHGGQYRYLKAMEELPPKRGRGGSGRRDSGSSWPGYEPPNLPPPDFQ